MCARGVGYGAAIMGTGMDFDQAIDIATRAAIADEAEDLDRDDYPNVSDYAWKAMRQRALIIASLMRADAELCDRAYELLAARRPTTPGSPPASS